MSNSKKYIIPYIIILFISVFFLSACKKNDPEKDDVVYVCGFDGTSPAYWKNGNEVKLASTKYESRTNSIFVVGNDVYNAGSEAYLFYKEQNIGKME